MTCKKAAVITTKALAILASVASVLILFGGPFYEQVRHINEDINTNVQSAAFLCLGILIAPFFCGVAVATHRYFPDPTYDLTSAKDVNEIRQDLLNAEIDSIAKTYLSMSPELISAGIVTSDDAKKMKDFVVVYKELLKTHDGSEEECHASRIYSAINEEWLIFRNKELAHNLPSLDLD